MPALAAAWKGRLQDGDLARGVEILTKKFATVDVFERAQIIEFYGSPDPETQTVQARRAVELVQQFLRYL